jgi:integrase
MDLFRKGKLIPEKKPMSFAEFAEGWWNPETCKYLRWRQVQNPLSPSTIDHYKTNLELHIKPYFGKMRLNAIMPEVIQNWVTRLSLDGYTNSSINIKVATLKAMLNEAMRLKLIFANPAEKIKKLKADNKEVQILKPEEARMLFPADWRTIWDSYESFIFNKLAACTGMRLSEIMGLKSGHVRNDHIHVCEQYSSKYGVRPLKTKDSRDIPITGPLYGELSALISKNNQGYIFSDSEGREPISRNRLYKETGKAFDRIGINREERKKRRITVHHWRHFLNTALLMANVNTLKIQKVTGHKSLSMTRHYAHFDCRDFTEVLDIQNSLFSGL